MDCVLVINVVILLAMVLAVDCRIYYNQIKLTPGTHYTVLMEREFGFLKDGEIHFSMSCSDQNTEDVPEFWLLFCSSADIGEFTRLSFTQLSFDCQRLLQSDVSQISGNNKANSYCIRQRLVHNTSEWSHDHYTLSRQCVEPAFYTIVLLQCQRETEKQGLNNITSTKGYMLSTCQSTLLALNPGNIQLSSDEMPLPVIYTIINLFWATLIGAWFFNWVIYFKFSNRLHQLISCAPIFKVILVVLVLLWWQEISNTGVEPKDISSIRVFVKSIEDALLFITMMIIAEGWGVVRCEIKHYRWSSLILLFLLFASSLMCVQWVHQYFLAFSVCCLVLILYKTFKWSSQNIELLNRRRRQARRFIARHGLRYRGYHDGEDGTSTSEGRTPCVTVDCQLAEKLVIYRRLRVAVATFAVAYGAACCVAGAAAGSAVLGAAARALVLEAPPLAVHAVLGVVLRLRDFAPYENIELVVGGAPGGVVVVELPGGAGGGGGVGGVEPRVALGIPQSTTGGGGAGSWSDMVRGRGTAEKETQTPRRRWATSII